MKKDREADDICGTQTVCGHFKGGKVANRYIGTYGSQGYKITIFQHNWSDMFSIKKCLCASFKTILVLCSQKWGIFYFWTFLGTLTCVALVCFQWGPLTHDHKMVLVVKKIMLVKRFGCNDHLIFRYFTLSCSVYVLKGFKQQGTVCSTVQWKYLHKTKCSSEN